MGRPDSAADPIRDFQQLSLLFTDPVQPDGEVMRPILLAAGTVTACRPQIGVERLVVGDTARRFVQHRMRGLVDHCPSRAGHQSTHCPAPHGRAQVRRPDQSSYRPELDLL
jgi:hypothetical protein